MKRDLCEYVSVGAPWVGAQLHSHTQAQNGERWRSRFNSGLHVVFPAAAPPAWSRRGFNLLLAAELTGPFTACDHDCGLCGDTTLRHERRFLLNEEGSA